MLKIKKKDITIDKWNDLLRELNVDKVENPSLEFRVLWVKCNLQINFQSEVDVSKSNTYSRCEDLEGNYIIKQCALDRKCFKKSTKLNSYFFELVWI